MLGGNALALLPGAHRMNGLACQPRQSVNANGPHNVGMRSHADVMHYASQERKHLLHNEVDYTRCMDTPAERLRIARIRAGFETAKEAAEAMGFPVSTYLAHENGSRGYPASKAFTYARKFKVREQWLLYGVGPAPGETDAPKAEVINIWDRLDPTARREALDILRILEKRNAS